jgi:glycerol-3-phosphate acyltransferase PlsY
VLLPFPTLVGGASWIATFYATRYVSLASIVAALVLPVAAFFLGEPQLLVGFAALVAGFVVIRHRANLQRLMAGTENRFVRRDGAGDPKP